MKNQEQLSENSTVSRDETQSSSSVREYSNTIPADLLIDIFSRVPSKSVARFRCVSKFWGSVLERPDFVKLFLTRCPRMLFTLEVDKEILYFSSPQYHSNPDDEKSNCVVATRNNMSFPKYVPSVYNRMLCGLVLREGHRRGKRGSKLRMICNPATGECVTLPKLLLKDETLPNVKPSIAQISFGYDPINKQFKVLCITTSNTHQVLTLGNGKLLWRRIECDFSFMVRDSPDICINGVLYIKAYFQTYSSGIVCFDIRSEKFSLVNFDKDRVEKSPYTCDWSILINYKGKFGVYNKKTKRHMCGFDLWVLEDAGNHKWSKHEHVYPPQWKKIFNEPGMRIIGMTSTGELVFAHNRLYNPFYVYYYNLERKTFTRVNILGFEEIKKRIDQTDTWETSIGTFVDYTENMKLYK